MIARDAPPKGAETFDADLRSPARATFVNQKVRRGEARDLRLMRHAENLIRARERFELQADGFGDATADACVNLVEDNRSGKARRTRAGLEDKHHARSLAARSNLRQRPQRFARVRREIELHAVEA